MERIKLSEPYIEELRENSEIIEEEFLNTTSISGFNSFPQKTEESKKLLTTFERNYCTRTFQNAEEYVYKPAWILWMLDLENINNIDNYISSLNKKDRYVLRKSLETIEGERYEVIVNKGIVKEILNEFYDLYRINIEKKKYGLNLLKNDLAVIKDNERFTGIFIKKDGSVIGGAICENKNNIFRTIYLANKKNTKGVDISRTLYYLIVQHGISYQFRYVSLGADPSLYGHVVSIGLFHLKKKMKFKPIPAQKFGEDNIDLYEKVNDVTVFEDNIAVSLGYTENNSTSSNLDAYIFFKNKIDKRILKIIESDFIENIYLKEV